MAIITEPDRSITVIVADQSINIYELRIKDWFCNGRVCEQKVIIILFSWLLVSEFPVVLETTAGRRVSPFQIVLLLSLHISPHGTNEWVRTISFLSLLLIGGGWRKIDSLGLPHCRCLPLRPPSTPRSVSLHSGEKGRPSRQTVYQTSAILVAACLFRAVGGGRLVFI